MILKDPVIYIADSFKLENKIKLLLKNSNLLTNILTKVYIIKNIRKL